MESKELRIGNYVYDALENIHQITSIDNVDLGLLGCSIELRFAKPIPLTEEWLLKFGFNKEVLGWKHWNFDLYLYLDNGCFESEQLPMFIYIKYVHQLQNLYFALTQTELVYEKTV